MHNNYTMHNMHPPSGTDAMYNWLPFKVDWKAELKKPSPGPLLRGMTNTKVHSIYILK